MKKRLGNYEHKGFGRGSLLSLARPRVRGRGGYDSRIGLEESKNRLSFWESESDQNRSVKGRIGSGSQFRGSAHP